MCHTIIMCTHEKLTRIGSGTLDLDASGELLEHDAEDRVVADNLSSILDKRDSCLSSRSTKQSSELVRFSSTPRTSLLGPGFEDC